MFWNIYSKRVIGTLRDREMIVWTWAFPILLSTLFFFTFTSLDTVSQLQVILLGVVEQHSLPRGRRLFRRAWRSVGAKRQPVV